jgi:hypothetical protein
MAAGLGNFANHGAVRSLARRPATLAAWLLPSRVPSWKSISPSAMTVRSGFAEFGDPQGRALFWLHGTPGARRQIPMEAWV